MPIVTGWVQTLRKKIQEQFKNISRTKFNFSRTPKNLILLSIKAIMTTHPPPSPPLAGGTQLSLQGFSRLHPLYTGGLSRQPKGLLYHAFTWAVHWSRLWRPNVYSRNMSSRLGFRRPNNIVSNLVKNWFSRAQDPGIVSPLVHNTIIWTSWGKTIK